MGTRVTSNVRRQLKHTQKLGGSGPWVAGERSWASGRRGQRKLIELTDGDARRPIKECVGCGASHACSCFAHPYLMVGVCLARAYSHTFSLFSSVATRDVSPSPLPLPSSPSMISLGVVVVVIVASIVTGTLLCSVVLLSASRKKRPRNAKPNEDATTKTTAHTIMMTTGPESAADVPFDLGRTRVVGTGIGIVVGTEIGAGVGVAVDATVGDSVVGDCVGCVVGLNVGEGVGMVVSRDEGAGVGEKVVKVGEGVGAGVGEKVVTLKLSTDASDIERRRRSPPPSSPVVRRRRPNRSAKFTISAVSVPSTTDVFSTSVTCSCTEAHARGTRGLPLSCDQRRAPSAPHRCHTATHSDTFRHSPRAPRRRKRQR